RDQGISRKMIIEFRGDVASGAPPTQGNPLCVVIAPPACRRPSTTDWKGHRRDDGGGVHGCRGTRTTGLDDLPDRRGARSPPGGYERQSLVYSETVRVPKVSSAAKPTPSLA